MFYTMSKSRNSRYTKTVSNLPKISFNFSENSASEIIDKFRDLLYDETTLSPDYEESTDPDMGVTRPSTTPSPSPSPSLVTTTQARLVETRMNAAFRLSEGP